MALTPPGGPHLTWAAVHSSACIYGSPHFPVGLVRFSEAEHQQGPLPSTGGQAMASDQLSSGRGSAQQAMESFGGLNTGAGAATAVGQQAVGVEKRMRTRANQQSDQWKQLFAGKDVRGVVRTLLDGSAGQHPDVLEALDVQPYCEDFLGPGGESAPGVGDTREEGW